MSDAILADFHRQLELINQQLAQTEYIGMERIVPQRDNALKDREINLLQRRIEIKIEIAKIEQALANLDEPPGQEEAQPDFPDFASDSEIVGRANRGAVYAAVLAAESDNFLRITDDGIDFPQTTAKTSVRLFLSKLGDLMRPRKKTLFTERFVTVWGSKVAYKAISGKSPSDNDGATERPRVKAYFEANTTNTPQK